ncbi:MAG: hypothetical protein P8Y67_11600 [Alphaproteobacteria bacterium]
MSEFFAWAATGLVTKLQTWAESDQSTDSKDRLNQPVGAADIQTPTHQRFVLRQHRGREIEIVLVDSGMSFRNGHAVTAVWAALKGAPYGHCIYLENHTTGAIARLPENIARIRPKISKWKATGISFFTTFPALTMLLAWLVYQRGLNFIQTKMFFISGSVAALFLLIIGTVAAKLISDYMQADNDQKIWAAADRALSNARRVLLQKTIANPSMDF